MTERIGLLRGGGYDLGPYATRYPAGERTMVRLLADQAADLGNATWLVFDGADELSFLEAYELANRVAHAIIATAGAGAHVALFLRNQREFMPAFYGAMAAGGAAVPLNADARGPLLEYVIERSDARILIARSDLVERLAELDSLGGVELVLSVGPHHDLPATVSGIPVQPFEEWIGPHPKTPHEPLPAGEDMALIQFTSGTTGRSKGVVYPHQFLYLYSAMLSDSLGRTRDDVLTTPLPLYHVAALHIIANSALHAGCTAHLKTRFSASAYWTQVAEDGATFSILLGPMAAIILKQVPDAPEHRMSTMFCVPPPPGREEFEQRFGVRLLWQGYGMTEIYPLPMRSEMLDGPPDTIGHPVTWMEYGVVDEHDRLLGPGEPGQLVFRPLLPNAMTTGYYKDPEATVAAFRNFMFHTNDLAVYDEDGCLHYRGRMQERIRRRGENVSALELELVTLRHPQVLEAAAYAVPGEFGEDDVKLDVVAKPGLELADLRGWLAENLPRYMVPRYLERRDAFPKTPSERVEKYKLAAEPVDRPGVLDAEADGPGR
jgi:crotonobetaine/carnitine-CoA ligase